MRIDEIIFYQIILYEDEIDLSLFNTGSSNGIEFVSQFSGKAGEAMLSYTRRRTSAI
nr:M10 family metallopeptidase C-terminal domain-containing protein [Serratia quinivorans]